MLMRRAVTSLPSSGRATLGTKSRFGYSKSFITSSIINKNIPCLSTAPLSCLNTALPTCSTVGLVKQFNGKSVIQQNSLYSICDINNQSCLTRPVAPLAQYCSLYTASTSQLDIKNGTPKGSDKPTIWVRFKTLVKDYWYIIVPIHFVTSCAWFGGFYLLVYSGVDVVQILENIGAGESILNALKKYEHTGNFAVAFFIYELAKPVRYMATLGATTAAIKFLAARGLIKFPKKEKLKTMYEDGQAEVRSRMKDGMGRMRVRWRKPRRKMRAMYKNMKMNANRMRNGKNGKRNSPPPK